MTTLEKIKSLDKDVDILRHFIGLSQRMVVADYLKGEESEYFIDKMNEIVATIKAMPKVYEQDGKGDEAIAYLHYFNGSWDWYITEKDCEPEQLQAFGLVKGFELELGYINIEEIIKERTELDFHWQPKTLAEIRKGLK